jgi:glyoxylase I family protein
VTAVHHIAYNCRDRDAQERFLTRHFGFRRVRVFSAGTPDEFVVLRNETCCIELFPASASAGGGEQAVGYKHLAFEVDDLEAQRAALVAEGLDVDALIDCGAVVPGLRVCFLRDAEGNIIELMERWSDDPAIAGA